MGRRTTMTGRRSAFRGACATALAIGIAGLSVGCGSSNDDSGTAKSAGSGTATAGAASGSESAGVAAAAKLTDPILQRPTKIAVTEPIGKPVPKGKNIALMLCSIPSCLPWGDHVKQASEALGWKVKTYNTGLTPESIQTAWRQAASDHPDGVVTIAYQSSAFRAQLDQFKKDKVPVVDCCAPEPAGNGISLMINALDNAKIVGKLMAAYAVSTTKGKVHPLHVDLGGLPISQSVAAGYTDEWNSLMPGVKLDRLTVPTSALGKDAPTRIVGYLRSHPDVDMVTASPSDLIIGLPAALKAANIDVPLVGEGSNPTVLGQVRAGDVQAAISFDEYGAAYTVVDGLARSFAGGDIEDSNKQLPFWWHTKDNLPAEQSFSLVPDAFDQYKKLWGIG